MWVLKVELSNDNKSPTFVSFNSPIPNEQEIGQVLGFLCTRWQEQNSIHITWTYKRVNTFVLTF